MNIDRVFIKYIPKSIRVFYGKLYAYLRTRKTLRKYFPLSFVEIEISTFCNLKCVGCYRTIHDYSSKNKYMSFADFKMYIDQLSSVSVLCLHGIGEPMLHQDISEIVEYAQKSGKCNKIEFTTNALACDPNVYRDLFSRGLSEISVSVDSLFPEEVARLRPHTDVDVLMNNIEYLCKVFSDKIQFRMTISKENFNMFQYTIKKLADLGAKAVTCQPFDDVGNAALCLSFEEKKDFLKKIEQIEIENFEIRAASWFKPTDYPCGQPLNYVVITVEGYLTPCCRIFDKDVFSYGNLKDVSLKKLFFSKEHAMLYNRMVRGEYPVFCRGCMGNHSEFNSSCWS